MGIQSLLFAMPTSSGPSFDPYFNNVSLLASMNGYNGSTTFVDSSYNEALLTPDGGAVISTAQSKFGGSSLFAGASPEARLTTTSGANFAFPGDFTVECWVYFTENDVGYQGLITAYTTGDQTAWALVLETDDTLSFYGSSGAGWGLILGTDFVPTLNTWQHIAVSRFEDTTTLYVDGVNIGSVASDLPVASGTTLEIGNYNYFPSGRAPLRGYLEEVRITQDVARYTDDFIPPTAAFPTQGPPANATDPYFSEVSFLLNTQGTTLADFLHDRSSNNRGATPQSASGEGGQGVSLSSSVSLFGESSLKVPSYGYLLLDPVSLDTSNSYTVEVWFRVDSVSGIQCILADGYPSNGLLLATSGSEILLTVAGDGNSFTSSGANIQADTWYFIQLIGTGTPSYINRVYLNGVLLGSLTCQPAVTSEVALIGAQHSGRYWFSGYFGGVRLTSGVARANDVPTAPFPYSGPPIDPYFAYVSLLLEMQNGVVGGSTFTDLSLLNRSIVTEGDIKITDAISKFGTTSAIVNTLGSYLAVSDATYSGDLTWECWWSPKATEPVTGYRFLFFQENLGLTLGDDGTSRRFFIGPPFYTTNGEGGASFVVGEWYHLAMTIQGTTARTFINGVLYQTGYIETETRVRSMWLMWHGTGSDGTFGYIDSIRETIGVARYITNFTPPSAPFPTGNPPIDPYFAYVSLLLNGDSFTDLSSNASAVTVYGNASIVSSGGPFGGAAMAFDGNGDYLTIPSSTLWNFGTGDWTVEVWIKLNEYGGTVGGATLFGTTYGAASGYAIQVGESANRFRLTSNASGAWADDLVPSSGPVLDAWEFMQITRNGSTISIAKNGTVVGTVGCAGYNFTNPSSIATIGLLDDYTNIRFLNGLIGPLRVTKGIARAITVPTAPFPTA